MRAVKRFDEPSGDVLHQRIAGLAPEGYTRAGAAIRHATATPMEQPAGHRLLLMLSDGKPNDEDGYNGRYAVEDTRQAILEAQGRGIHPYCLTIDRKGREYLTRIFGESGHTILQHPEQLPMALADVIRRLLGARA
jgi:nitric oxide reductase NorD protein